MKHALLRTGWIVSNNKGKNAWDRLGKIIPITEKGVLVRWECPKCVDSFATKQILKDHMITQHKQ